MSELTELDKRLSVHEAQCVERYDTILSSIGTLKEEIKNINSKAWGAMVWGVITLSSSCVGLCVYIITKGIGL